MIPQLGVYLPSWGVRPFLLLCGGFGWIFFPRGGLYAAREDGVPIFSSPFSPATYTELFIPVPASSSCSGELCSLLPTFPKGFP